MDRPLRIAMITTEGRGIYGPKDAPLSFGTAPQALIEGFDILFSGSCSADLSSATFYNQRASTYSSFDLHILSCNPVRVAQPVSKIASNITHHSLFVPRWGWLKTGYQGCIRAVRTKLKEIRPDIVHGQGTERECAICAALSGYPSVVTIHGVMRAIHDLTRSNYLNYYWFARHLETFALRRIRGVISISPYVEALVAPLTSRTWFIPNALQDFFFTPSSSRQRRPGPVRFVNVGVISPRKQQVELLEHLIDLRREVDFAITFVGKATKGNPYTKRFHELLQVADTTYGGFKHREYIPDEAFRDLYDDADAMIHFSTEESFGLTFAEALARNLTLFASDVGAIRQIAKGIPSCRIFAQGDFDGLSNSLRSWLRDAAHMLPRATTPNQLIASRYHPKVIAMKHLDVYREILQRTP
jgi:glycosyltransferase involved in cell wall biosynthesis